MKQSLQIAKALVRIIKEDGLPVSKFSSNGAIIEKLKSLDVISIDTKGRGKVVSKGKFFQAYIERNYNGNPSSFIAADSRGELINDYGDDKAKKVAPQKGLFLWSRDSITLTPSTVVNNEEGVVTFIHDRIDISLLENITIIGVENFESLTYAPHLYKHFSFPDKCLFIYRNSSFNKLIKSVPLEVLYIPDYDIFGIKIFEVEILKNNPSTKLLLPYNIENIFAHINTSKKYLEQSQMKGAKYIPATKDGKHIIELIRRYKRIIPQEYFHYSKLKNTTK